MTDAASIGQSAGAALGVDHGRLALLTSVDVRQAAERFESADAATVLASAIGALGTERLPLVTSLAPEGIVILDMLTRITPKPRVLTLDTGRLPAETYDLMDRVRERFSIELEVLMPDPVQVGTMVRERGVNLFYNSKDDRLRCCEVRKVLPLRRALKGTVGWVTGLRREQTPGRRATPKIARDLSYGMIWKVAPLADWTGDQVWAYVRRHDLPYNALHSEGYESIGCAPCSRPVGPGEDERAGRWWWETSDGNRECGLHVVRPSEIAGSGI